MKVKTQLAVAGARLILRKVAPEWYEKRVGNRSTLRILLDLVDGMEADDDRQDNMPNRIEILSDPENQRRALELVGAIQERRKRRKAKRAQRRAAKPEAAEEQD